MLKVLRFTVENLTAGCITDRPHPRFSFALDSDRSDALLRRATLRVGTWSVETDRQIAIPYEGPALRPFTTYTATLVAEDDAGETARASLVFETGRMDTPWTGQWISDPRYRFTEKKVSPLPMTFRRRISLKKPIVRARVLATAMGIYELYVNGSRAGDRYFAPGFTSYRANLQYQTLDITSLLKEENELRVVVAGGWAVGSFVFTRVNRITADRQALLLELHLQYADGSREILGTDSSWEVTEDGPWKMADLYDGETYDATCRYDTARWGPAAPEKLKISPRIRADFGAPVRVRTRLRPVSCTPRPDGSLIYDFGQNFAGVVELKLQGRQGQKVTVRHAPILNPDGTLNTRFLRTAQAAILYTCREGEQTYAPTLTYMGFRYISVTGIDREHVQVTGLVLCSDVEHIGDFSCSNPLLNQLQSNIVWGATSNFMDIPTDCPQRDERMGWTGDIAVFSPTACFNFDMSRFLDKWLLDLRAEQRKGGGFPNTIPPQGYGFPTTMPDMAVDWWDDACILVPWAEYQARGDTQILRDSYDSMKKYVKACIFWAGLFSIGKKKYIWDTPATLHFGDWVAPDVPRMSQWQGRAKWTATASLRNTTRLLSRIAAILGESEDATRYADYSDRVADAFSSLLTDGNGTLLGEQFQTGYVLPLWLDMFATPQARQNAADNLVRLAERREYRIGTGFPGTPFLLFALADNGHADTAYRMLLNTKCPSWLYEVKMGATTIWERWDGLDENGVCPIGDDGTDLMISYNHYASGAVGDFLYRRVVGLEAEEPGWKVFSVRPVPGGDLTWAKASTRTPYGLTAAEWRWEKGVFTVTVQVPFGARCHLTLPDGATHSLGSGIYSRSCPLATI